MTYPKVLFSSEKDQWATPKVFFETLNSEFNFTLDPCASIENAKCSKFFTKAEDGLMQDWGSERVFCNPPYGKQLQPWTRKCFEASLRGATVVALLPASTGTRWFHNNVLGKAELRFIKGRLKFGDAKFAAPFSSVIAVYHPPKSQNTVQLLAA